MIQLFCVVCETLVISYRPTIYVFCNVRRLTCSPGRSAAGGRRWYCRRPGGSGGRRRLCGRAGGSLRTERTGCGGPARRTPSAATSTRPRSAPPGIASPPLTAQTPSCHTSRVTIFTCRVSPLANHTIYGLTIIYFKVVNGFKADITLRMEYLESKSGDDFITLFNNTFVKGRITGTSVSGKT